MKKTAAWLTRYALEQIGVKYTFGIPGVHNTELYDELNNSDLITPNLVMHEGHGGFMADAISRVTDSIGTLVIVPAAGVTHAASGIAEAYLDGIPMLVITGGIRNDSKFDYQLHELDQLKLVAGFTKAAFKINNHDEVINTIYKAYDIATSGEPGPVFIEIPVNLQLDKAAINALPTYVKPEQAALSASMLTQIENAAQMLMKAKNPAIFVGWGAAHASSTLIEISEVIGSPVATTMQGISVFPANHPLHTGFCFGPAAVPAAQNAFDNADCVLAIGTRFGEIATGSFGGQLPQNLIHIDINPDVFDANYKSAIAIEGDAKQICQQLLSTLKTLGVTTDFSETAKKIAADKKSYRETWYQHDSKEKVNPALYFDELRAQLSDDAHIVVDDGNHTFLTAELMPIHQAYGFISPTDFNCMGYATPAAIAVKMAKPQQEVHAIVGDGAFMMTATELATAVSQNLGLVIGVFNDGELSQIAQAQQIPYNRKTCTVLPQTKLKGLAMATGAEYVRIENNNEIKTGLTKARALAQNNKTVILDINIDYSKATAFTEGAVKTNLTRMPLPTKVRMVGRALVRKVTG
ncbi:thiamine pyrophosphate-binding protein [Colwellia sp. 1_MG-2023]|uniref:thiamine pyrophosphate-binding protein n=1 Tax=unclassified Colwellia TaxID=196834 RepID=UPI001C09644C|nr:MULTISPECIES: thiamine pyrophosphate-binding protein [unclassified Colwellia]MBU2924343.1 thiamine pyrophosphate-binding protein [Colwellia sp. C2M11]MDO6650855.1 thiamine pyrophosphate-binding protein [Colwellia sp. 3_MG-2023]MDO6663890.1 thiamine pyrophosphate-binding protein [Colwellia sp. 2_MG-2023]MDO6688241.1 thiamine pyrophosphate-binding protein [Colwellia sp. 1_MG-2023]